MMKSYCTRMAVPGVNWAEHSARMGSGPSSIRKTLAGQEKGHNF